MGSCCVRLKWDRLMFILFMAGEAAAASDDLFAHMSEETPEMLVQIGHAIADGEHERASSLWSACTDQERGDIQHAIDLHAEGY